MNDEQNLQPASVIAGLFGTDIRRIQQLKESGVIVGYGRPAMYDLFSTVKALFQYQREIIQSRIKDETVADLERQKLRAEADIKSAKAEIAQMELAELQGKLHRAEDVEAITTDHVLFFRSMLMAMPGKLAVDLSGYHTAAEQAEKLKGEVYYILDQLVNYKYDPTEYKKRVMERQGWESAEKESVDD